MYSSLNFSTESKDTPKSSAKKTPDKKASTAKKGTTDSKAKGAPTAKEKKESGKSLWVSNLSSITRAADLKTRFSQHGKVSRVRPGTHVTTNVRVPSIAMGANQYLGCPCQPKLRES